MPDFYTGYEEDIQDIINQYDANDPIESFFVGRTFPKMMQDMMSYAGNHGVDNREGSIIYDATAVVAKELSSAYYFLAMYDYATDIRTAYDEWLDRLAELYGMTRQPATYAVRLGQFYDREGNLTSVPIGTQFSTLDNDEQLIFEVTAPYVNDDGAVVAGNYRVTATTAGTAANSYVGEITPIDFVNIGSAFIVGAALVPAQDQETDDHFRERIYQKLREPASNGNRAAYKEFVGAIDGVGQLQVYDAIATNEPDSHVVLSIIDGDGNPISEDFQNTIKGLVDPANASGNYGTGLGMAPIGAIVDVTTPIEETINIDVTVTLESSFTLGMVEQQINAAISSYIDSVRNSWGSDDEYGRYNSTIFTARIISAVISVAGIINVTSITINNRTNDLVLAETRSLQEIPIVGTITVLEG